MKKLIVSMCLLATCVLVGCGGDNEKVIGNDNNSQQEGESGNTATGTGYVFKSGDATVVIDAEAAPILEALGEASSYYESPSCAFGDLDKMYTYPGFELDTYSLNNTDYISAVIFFDDSVTTAEGVCIGDAASKVKEVYGEATSETSTMLSYEKDQTKLCFIIQDGVVISIEYRTMILG